MLSKSYNTIITVIKVTTHLAIGHFGTLYRFPMVGGMGAIAVEMIVPAALMASVCSAWLCASSRPPSAIVIPQCNVQSYVSEYFVGRKG